MVNGRRLHPDSATLLANFAEQGVRPYDQLSVLEARATVAGSTRLQGGRVPVASVSDVLIPGPGGRIPVRIYDPQPGRRLPLMVYMHGGGFVAGSVAVADRPCRALAAAAECIVASVEYRLAPETPFPGPLHDCTAAVTYFAEHGRTFGSDGGPVIVMGDSAGGNLAAATVQQLHASGNSPVARQVLLYPTLSVPHGVGAGSMVDNGQGFMMTARSLEWFWDHYLNTEADASDPRAVPALATSLAGLPPALVVVAEFDPLRDEGIAYAERLSDEGVEVELNVVSGALHGFWWMAGVLAQADELTGWLGTRLRR